MGQARFTECRLSGGRSGRLIIISKVCCGSVGGPPLATHPWPNGNFLNHARLRRFDLASTSQDTTSNRSYFLSANSGRTARAFAIALALAVASSAANIVRTCSSPVADRPSLTENTVLPFIYCSFFHASSLCRSYHIDAMSAVTSTFGDKSDISWSRYVRGRFMGTRPSTTLADFERHGIPKSVFL